MTFDRLINIQTYSDDELKALAQQLADEEREISRRRRLLHGEIDIVRAEMVRRLRDKHGSGQSIFKDGDITALTAILAGKGPAEVASDQKSAAVPTSDKTPPQTPAVAAEVGGAASPAKSVPPHRAIQERFRDLSVNVRDERLIRYITKQLSEGRHLDAIVADDYIVTHANEVKRAQLIQNPQVLRALEEQVKKQFADYDSATRPRSDRFESD
jgi:hypothetical protein